ncbi:hypothetical protein [Flavobacterium sp. N2550]|nr:hypothetical protein [Flavobacterium sp. N2550]
MLQVLLSPIALACGGVGKAPPFNIAEPIHSNSKPPSPSGLSIAI